MNLNDYRCSNNHDCVHCTQLKSIDMNLPKYDIKMIAKKRGRNHTKYDTKCSAEI